MIRGPSVFPDGFSDGVARYRMGCPPVTATRAPDT